MKKLSSMAELIRMIDVCLIAGAVVAGGYFAAGGLRPDLLIAALGAAFIAAGAYVINDWRDEPIDQINKPHRPIPSGRVSRVQALTLALTLQAIGLAISLFLNTVAVLVVLLCIALANLYTLILEDIPLVGNITTAFLLGATFVFGSVAVGSIENSWLLGVVIFLGNVGREIIKDIEDIPGDRLNGVKTLAGLIGSARASTISVGLFITSVLLLFDVRLVGFFNDTYFWLISLVIVPMTAILAVRCLRTGGACAAWASGWSKAIYGVMLTAVVGGMVPGIS